MGWGRTGALIGLLAVSSAGAREATERPWIEAAHRRIRKDQASLTQVARRALPSVVAITTKPAVSGLSPLETEAQQGIGSGFIIHPSGYILTSAHVVEEASEVRVTLALKPGATRELTAKVVGADPRTDTALLKIEAGHPLPALPLGTADRLQVADWVVVIGNPFGLSHTVSVGVVSFLGRTDVMPGGRDIDFDYIQTDACINPGSSGGPVLDARGRVVAVANAVNVSGQGIGFAVPIDIPKAVLADLQTHGKVERGWMGVAVQDLNSELGASLGLEETHGVVVSDVTEGGPGARAGLRVGDIITLVGSTPVDRAHALRWRVSTRGAGAKVGLTARRDGRRFRVQIQLEPQDDALAPLRARSGPAVGGSGATESPAVDQRPTPPPP